ncbi:MAG TPA: hypothetical protein VIM87_12945 [Chitinophaga sp.]|uniref:hypothetical protein n=1 Tax=Chitinophaga sp. TaxID=1869181 RepID=UPI002F94A976
MKYTFLPVVLILSGLLFIHVLPEETPVNNKNEVFVLATLYSRHNSTPVYNLDTLKKIISAIGPEVFVLDVNPKELKEQKVYPSKIEYPGVIFPLVNEMQRPAYAAEPPEPVFTEIVQAVIKARKGFDSTRADESRLLQQYTGSLFNVLKIVWQTPADVNGQRTDKALAGKRVLEDQLIGPVDMDGDRRWTQNIVNVTLQAAKAHPGKRILVLIGIENCHGVRAALRMQNGIQLIDMEQWLRRQ